MSDTQPVRVAVDIGGTFTDLELHDARTGRPHAYKTPSTPSDPSEGLINGLRGAATQFGFEVSDIGLILHGSTIATNAVLERKLPKGALITTKGFRDVLEIGRHMRKDVYALRAEPRALLIPRQHRHEVSERILSDGTVETALDEDELGAIADQLRADQIEAVAVMFLHAYRNPVNERRAAQRLAEWLPGVTIATSFDSSPEIREYERVSTTVLNALLKPVISRYIERLSGRLADAGVDCPLYLVQSNGGVATPSDAANLPAKLLLSGPAGGAMAMANLAQTHDISNLVGFDMGGTSSDVSVVIDGTIGETAESSIDGLPVRLPMIEIRTIGAGGGSIARLEDGALRVGPQSAGAVPGPVCYDRGGDTPAVTDANAVLGRIDPDAFLGGGMKLDIGAAQSVLSAKLAEPLSLSDVVAAAGILDVATMHMAAAIRLSLFEKGADPADFALAPFGGAAGLHACAVADELSMQRIIFPANASTLSARGILFADLRHDLSHSELLVLEKGAEQRLTEIVTDLRAQARDLLQRDSVAKHKQRVDITCDLRYRGQAFELTTPWLELGNEDAGPTAAAIQALVSRFHEAHETRFSYSVPEDPVELITVRAVAIGLLDKPDTTGTAVVGGAPRPTSRRLFADGDWREVPVYERAALSSNPTAPAISGPALIAEQYTVLLIASGWQLTPLPNGDLMCTKVVQ